MPDCASDRWRVVTKRPRAPLIEDPDLPSKVVDIGTIDLGSNRTFEDVLIAGAVVGEGPIEGLTLSGCRLANVELTGATLRNVSIVDALFTDCELSGTTFDFASFQRVRFERCRMSGFVAPQLEAPPCDLRRVSDGPGLVAHVDVGTMRVRRL